MMRLLLLLCIIFLWTNCNSAEYSTRERIELHKAWLARRAALKAQSENDGSYFRKIIRFKDSSAENLDKNKHKKFDSSKNDILSSENNEAKEVPVPKTNFSEIIGATKLSQNLQNNFLTTEQTSTTSTEIPTTFYEIQNFDKPTTPYTTETPYYDLSSTEPMSTVYSTISSIKHKKVKTHKVTSDTENSRNNLTSDNSILTEQRRGKLRERQSVWGSWLKWSECSRSCGGGIMSQRRHCISRFKHSSALHSGNRTSKNCIGLYKRYRICNDQDCPDATVDFRERQCMHFNNHTFKGKTYEWEAYIKDDAECELNCKPIGMNYFATLNETVIDGTPCTRPNNDYLRRIHAGKSICVEGICKAVHSSGVVTGVFMNNGAVPCGSLICRPISGLFTKNPLPMWLVHVATIPTGASNISITELKSSMNLLVLRHSDQRNIINGEYTSVSLSGIYEAAGAIFDYQRIDGLNKNGSTEGYRKLDGVTEWITCAGPITEPVHLMVLAHEKNPGIKYEYLLPINSDTTSSEELSYEQTSAETEAPALTTVPAAIARHTLKSGLVVSTPINSSSVPKMEKRKRKVVWKVVGFHPCNKSCGGGVRAPIIRCVRENPTKYFVPKRCAHLTKPVLNPNVTRCNIQPCPAYWKIGEWSDCNCDDYSDDEFRKREIKCVQELGTGLVIQVLSGACLEDKPVAKQSCDCPKSNKMDGYKYRGNGISPIKHHGNKFSNSIYGNNSITKRTPVQIIENKNVGVWLSSEWNEQCSVDCGNGIQYRSIFCDRSPPFIDRCDNRFTPDTTRQCTVSNQCDSGDWFIGPWTQCSGDCFNLTQTRLVYCIKSNSIVDDNKCNSLEKPEIVQKCQMSDVLDCKPRWHYSEWSECSKKCDGGKQRRTIKCFEPTKDEMREADNCKYNKRKPAIRECNTHRCDSTTEPPSDPRVDLVQNDITPDCKDVLPICKTALEQHLCNYQYFQEQCCETCHLVN